MTQSDFHCHEYKHTFLCYFSSFVSAPLILRFSFLISICSRFDFLMLSVLICCQCKWHIFEVLLPFFLMRVFPYVCVSGCCLSWVMSTTCRRLSGERLLRPRGCFGGLLLLWSLGGASFSFVLVAAFGHILIFDHSFTFVYFLGCFGDCSLPECLVAQRQSIYEFLVA